MTPKCGVQSGPALPWVFWKLIFSGLSFFETGKKRTWLKIDSKILRVWAAHKNWNTPMDAWNIQSTQIAPAGPNDLSRLANVITILLSSSSDMRCTKSWSCLVNCELQGCPIFQNSFHRSSKVALPAAAISRRRRWRHLWTWKKVSKDNEFEGNA